MYHIYIYGTRAKKVNVLQAWYAYKHTNLQVPIYSYSIYECGLLKVQATIGGTQYMCK